MTKKELEKLAFPSTRASWNFIDETLQDAFGQLEITEPNSLQKMIFDIDGYWRVEDYDGKTLKRYKTFKGAMDYLLSAK